MTTTALLKGLMRHHGSSDSDPGFLGCHMVSSGNPSPDGVYCGVPQSMGRIDSHLIECAHVSPTN